MLGKGGTEPTLKQLLLRFYHQRRPQKQLVLGVLSPISFPNYPIISVVVVVIYYLFIYLLPVYLYLLPVSAHSLASHYFALA